MSDIEKLQAIADAEYYISTGHKLTDGRIERFYRENTGVIYSLNEFFEAVYKVSQTNNNQ